MQKYDIIYVPIGGIRMKSVLKELKLSELKKLQMVISQYSDMEELKRDLDIIISTRETEKKTSLNIRFNMEMFEKLRIFDPWEFQVIKNNHINNLQELIDCNLDELKGITPSIKEGLDWVRKFYDMRSLENPSKKKTKK